MPIGAIVPGSNVDVTPDVSPSYYTLVQAPSATQIVRAQHLQALTLVVLNVQEKLRTFVEDPTYSNTHTATWDDGSTALFKFGSHSTYELGAAVDYKSGSQITHESGALENYEDGSITTFESNSYLHLDGTNYVTGYVNVNTGGFITIYAGAHLVVGSGVDVGAELWLKVGSVFKVDCNTTFASGTETDFKAGSVQYFEGDSVVTGTIRFAGAGRLTKHKIIGPDANASFSATDGQTIVVPVLTTTRTYIMLAAGASEGDEMTVSLGPLPAGTSHGVVLKRDDASTIFAPLFQATGSLGWMDIVFTGGAWQAARWGLFG